ncbi:MAG: thioredoxin domain-containing protein [Gammaproteobacteria bacterium]
MKSVSIIILVFFCQMALSKTHPGIMDYSETLNLKIAEKLQEKGAGYKPRTHHLINNQPKYTNRLIFEDSPYLLQHAHNPVNWYAWGKEAFDQAKKENKPVFLSIGYATCHWCHVMEEESFEDEAIAKFLNENFISIKVDREQYPDVDETYMTAVMMMTGSGGWPMSSFLLPDSRPFFGGTYFPPASFTELLNKVAHTWKVENTAVIEQAEELSAAVKKATSTRSEVKLLGQNVIHQAVKNIVERYDPQDGGFSRAPKFPNESSLLLLLQAPQNEQKNQALEHTLTAMAQGGVYDQIAGGFHRYSVDSQWLVPHFEKMLYNQAYLSRVYAEAWRQNGNPLHARVARQTLDYVLREMTRKDGVFYSATDADSEGEEGTFFIWSKKEIEELFDQKDAEFIIRLYGVTKDGNFEGKNIFHLPQSLTDIALQENVSLPDLLTRIDRLNTALLESRQKRIPPLTDNKIILTWNGMMITALAEAGAIFKDHKYIAAAEKAAALLWEKQRYITNHFWRVNLDGKPSIPARQDDYAHYSEALLALYDVTGDRKWLERAKLVIDEMIVEFQDHKTGVFLMGNDEILFAQPKSTHDGATPSGNSVAVRVLSRLTKRLGDHQYDDKAHEVLQAFSGTIADYPGSYAYMLEQLHELLNGESGDIQFAARGAIRITGEIIDQKSTQNDQDNNQYDVLIALDIADGWHINADQPLHENLIATQISLDSGETAKLSSIEYPEALLKHVDFEEKPLALYTGKVEIRSKLDHKILKIRKINTFDRTVDMVIQIQACNQSACLAPESVKLSLALPL